jgi:hypothetical protein
MLGLWIGRDIYRATPAVTRDLGFSGLNRRTTPFSRLLQHTRICGGSILKRILTGSNIWWNSMNNEQSSCPVGNTNLRIGQTWTSGYTRDGIRCLRGVSISCRPVTPAVSPISNAKFSIQIQSVQIRQTEKPAVKISVSIQVNGYIYLWVKKTPRIAHSVYI